MEIWLNEILRDCLAHPFFLLRNTNQSQDRQESKVKGYSCLSSLGCVSMTLLSEEGSATRRSQRDTV